MSEGTVHVARRGVYEGQLITARMHIECERVTVDDQWGEDFWEDNDPSEFRKRLEQLTPAPVASESRG